MKRYFVVPQQQNKRRKVATLPQDLLHKILGFLSVGDRITSRLVCKDWCASVYLLPLEMKVHDKLMLRIDEVVYFINQFYSLGGHISFIFKNNDKLRRFCSAVSDVMSTIAVEKISLLLFFGNDIYNNVGSQKEECVDLFAGMEFNNSVGTLVLDLDFSRSFDGAFWRAVSSSNISRLSVSNCGADNDCYLLSLSNITHLDSFGTYGGLSDDVFSLDMHNLKTLRIHRSNDDFSNFRLSSVQSLTYSSCHSVDIPKTVGLRNIFRNTVGLINILSCAKQITEVTLESYNSDYLNAVRDHCKNIKTLALYDPIISRSGYGLENLLKMRTLEVLVIGVIGRLPKSFKEEFLSVLPRLEVSKVVAVTEKSKDCEKSNFLWTIAVNVSLEIRNLKHDSYFYE